MREAWRATSGRGAPFGARPGTGTARLNFQSNIYTMPAPSTLESRMYPDQVWGSRRALLSSAQTILD